MLLQDAKSYAAIARVMPSQQSAPKTSPAQDQSPVSPASTSGDNNNNAENKATPSPKTDNLFYSTAAKNTTGNSTTAHSPRKSAPSHPRSNGPLKPKNNDRPSPASPTNRNPTNSHTSAAVVAR